MKRKIVFIHHCGTKSGAANSLITLIRHLDKAKFECLVLCPKGSAFGAFEEVADKVHLIQELPEIITISGSSSNYVRLFKAALLYRNLNEVYNIIDRLNPDIIHFNEISLSSVARRLKNDKRIIVFHARVVLDHKTNFLNQFIIKRLNRYADHVICIDESVRNLLNGLDKTSVVYNSYQFPQLELENNSTTTHRKFGVLFLANLIKYKGVFDLLEAAKLLKEHADIEIRIAGGNSRPDIFFKSLKGKILNLLGLVKDNRTILQREIDKFNLNERIKLIGNVKDIEACILDCHVNIFPSYMDGPSRSIFEAGVFGKPSIISLHHKINDVVEDEITGLVIDEHSPDQIAKAILRLRDNREFLHAMGRNAKEKYMKLNDPVINAKNVERIYAKLLDKIVIHSETNC